MNCFSRLAFVVLVAAASFAQQSPIPAPAPDVKPTAPKKADRAAAYYHYSLAHNYEELATLYGRSEYVTRAIEEYKLAIQRDNVESGA